MIADEIKEVLQRPWIRIHPICTMAGVDYNRTWQWVNRNCALTEKEIAKLSKTMVKHQIK